MSAASRAAVASATASLALVAALTWAGTAQAQLPFSHRGEAVPRDVREILQLAEDAAVPKSLRKGAVGALNYMLLNLDIGRLRLTEVDGALGGQVT